MDKADLCFTPATELAGAIRAKEFSSVEITSTVLERIAALEPKLNGFAHLAAEEAMDRRGTADSALAKESRHRTAARHSRDHQGSRTGARHAVRTRHIFAPRRCRNRR